MSKATKRKHVTKEILEDYYVPEDSEVIAKIVSGRGNNLHEVVTSEGDQYLVSMPTKFRRNVWVKRGDFVVISPIKEGVKVQGEIVYILYNKQIKYLKNEKLWPKAFNDDHERENESSAQQKKEEQRVANILSKNSDESDDSSDNDDDLFVNPNHRPILRNEEESDSDEESESSSDEEKEDDDQNGNSMHRRDENTVDCEQTNIEDQIKTVKV